ncbi:hypothetical protein PILCRDRAFT_816785 [Piloderma croceum F 1598]|uniref:Uncharacterized protein n=1 Tax=Piloderma croceum (strain F 1598) TaxID=765440 RepID=A0A0C3C7C6_PILCF|nr:hypothetical protein PILCRDRAFT_816785 [Piloderma croceum F 1598]
MSHFNGQFHCVNALQMVRFGVHGVGDEDNSLVVVLGLVGRGEEGNLHSLADSVTRI